MTDADDASKSRDESGSDADASSSNVQSLTDLFDQMDRAAFKRALANRDANGNSLNKSKSQSR